MRGTVLGFDRRSGEGKISGDDGARYSFGRGEWHGKTAPTASQKVDFETSGTDARAVYPMRGGIGPAASHDRSRIAAALLAIFGGSIGLHKLYIGKYAAGIVMLIVAIGGVVFAAIPTALMATIGIVEGLIYLFMSDERFDATYVSGSRAWF
ncbi:MAG: TM2 domain-containing protein [Pseudomonadota bacterium]